MIRLLLNIRVISDTPSAHPVHIRTISRDEVFLTAVAVENMAGYSKSRACRCAAQKATGLAWAG